MGVDTCARLSGGALKLAAFEKLLTDYTNAMGSVSRYALFIPILHIFNLAFEKLLTDYTNAMGSVSRYALFIPILRIFNLAFEKLLTDYTNAMGSVSGSSRYALFLTYSTHLLFCICVHLP